MGADHKFLFSPILPFDKSRSINNLLSSSVLKSILIFFSLLFWFSYTASTISVCRNISAKHTNDLNWAWGAVDVCVGVLCVAKLTDHKFEDWVQEVTDDHCHITLNICSLLSGHRLSFIMIFIEVVLNDEKAIKETNHWMHKSYFHLYSLLPPVALKLLTLECQQTAFFKQTPILFSFWWGTEPFLSGVCTSKHADTILKVMFFSRWQRPSKTLTRGSL